MSRGDAAHAALRAFLDELAIDGVTVTRTAEHDDEYGTDWCPEGYQR